MYVYSLSGMILYKMYFRSLKNIILRAYPSDSSYYSTLAFVPKYQPVKEKDLDLLKKFFENEGKLCVLTGAGISTESGIPDYRSEGVGLYATTLRRPILYQDFINKEHRRRRYWARNYIGWPRFSSFQPNITHKIVKYLENIERVSCIVTQNVDGLHTKAESLNVIELHGTVFVVVCLSCDRKISRFDFQKTLRDLNPDMIAQAREIRPDGDTKLSQLYVQDFVVPRCENCGGILKPDVVFFGENLPRSVVENVRDKVHQADALLVLGTSLSTYSGYRIVLQAIEEKKRIAIVNIGESRADDHATVKVASRCGEVLSKLFDIDTEGTKNSW